MAPIEDPQDFGRHAHAIIWAAGKRLRTAGRPSDYLSIRAELDRAGHLETVGAVYLADLAKDSVRPSEAAVLSAASEITAAARARRLRAILTRHASAEMVDLSCVLADLTDLTPTLDPATASIPAEELLDAADVAARGRQIEAAGIPYLLDGIIPAYGMLGFLVAFAKVGKTTFGQVLAAHIAMGLEFLGRATRATRVLILAAEDPPEYTAWLARHLDVEPGRLTFRCAPLVLTPKDLQRICATVKAGGYGLVLIASWQAVVRGLLRDENDNAGAVQVVESVKAATRETGIPWLIDAHSGKGEDQQNDADPSKAMRGASSAAGAADYTLSLRYGNGTFGTQRRLSGKGRFVSFGPLVLDYDPTTSHYTLAGEAKQVQRDTTWRLICEVEALDLDEPRSLTDIGRRIGMVVNGDRLSGTQRKQLHGALNDRPDVAIVQDVRRGQKTTMYRRLVL